MYYRRSLHSEWVTYGYLLIGNSYWPMNICDSPRMKEQTIVHVYDHPSSAIKERWEPCRMHSSRTNYRWEIWTDRSGPIIWGVGKMYLEMVRHALGGNHICPWCNLAPECMVRAAWPHVCNCTPRDTYGMTVAYSICPQTLMGIEIVWTLICPTRDLIQSCITQAFEKWNMTKPSCRRVTLR